MWAGNVRVAHKPCSLPCLAHFLQCTRCAQLSTSRVIARTPHKLLTHPAVVDVTHHPLLSQAANKMAYHDQSFATPDAMRVGRLHTHMPGWTDANIAFMRSGGYSISSRIPEVQQPTLVLWGRQDEILEPKYAAQFEAALTNGQLQWIEECGHCGHLEKPTEVCVCWLRGLGLLSALLSARLCGRESDDTLTGIHISEWLTQACFWAAWLQLLLVCVAGNPVVCGAVGDSK